MPCSQVRKKSLRRRQSLSVGLCPSPAWPEASAEMQAAFHAFARKLSEAGHNVTERALPATYDRLADAQALIHRREAWMTMGHIRRAHPDRVSAAFRRHDRRRRGRERSGLPGGARAAAAMPGKLACRCLPVSTCCLCPARREPRRRGLRRPAIPPSSASGPRSARRVSASPPPGAPMACRWACS